MNEEIIDTNVKKKYDAEVLILFERGETNYKVTILQQTLKRSEADWRIDRTHEIDSVSNMQITESTFFLKGDMDFETDEKSETISFSRGDMWLELLPQCPFITVVTSREDANKLLIEDTATEEIIDETELKLECNPTAEDIKNMIELVDLDVFCRIIQCRLKLENEGSFYGSNRPTMEDIGKINKKWAKKYLQDWAKAKFRFYKLFGNKLTIEKEVEYIPLRNDFKNKIEDLKYKFPLYKPIFDSINYECYEKNKMLKGWYNSCFESIAKPNMSLTKFLTFYNNNDLNMEISKFYQSKGKTNLTISIDPCDYLTVSINNSGWKSCHNFFNGCYANAGLSYMHDNTSLVSFSSNGKSKYTGHYRDFEWNNKKWREMIYVSEENSAIAFSRQYPYYEEKYSKVVRELFEDTYANYFNVESKWLITNNSKKYLDVVGIEHYGDNNLLYNDIRNGYNYKVAINKFDNKKEKVECLIGKCVKRLGNEDADINEGESKIW